jgi:hypothetical protein
MKRWKQFFHIVSLFLEKSKNHFISRFFSYFFTFSE